MAEILDDANHDAEQDYIFNEYAIDDTLDPLARLLRYHQSDFSLQRLVLARDLVDTAKFAGYQDTARDIVPLLPQFTADSEPVVRQTLVSQLFPLAKLLLEEGGDLGYQTLLTMLLPAAFELLVDKNVEVGTYALQAIKAMADLVRPADVQANLLTVVITLAHDERAEDYRVVAAQLFNDLAPIFGRDACLNVALPEMELLSNDNSFSVRKAVASNLGSICRVLPPDVAITRAVPLFTNLCHDDVWGVRQACAEKAEDIAEALPEEARLQDIVPAFQHLLEDSSRWVRNHAHESLGRLIHCLRSEDISTSLLQLYTNMPFQSESGDFDLGEYCAFTFPAVVQAIGPSRWDEVEDAYSTMLRDAQWKVRKSLAYSIHELALMVGMEITEKSLVPAFETLLRDLDDIKLGVVLNVDQFLSVVSAPTLERLIPTLCHVPLNSENWRLRNEVARRIGSVGVLLDPTSSPAFEKVIALVLRLLDDSVMEVRSSTYKPAAVLLKHLSSCQRANVGNYLEEIQRLSERDSFQGRQMFLYVAQQVAEVGADELLEEAFLDRLMVVADDPVSNVRLVVDDILTKSFLPKEHWANHPKIQSMQQALQRRRHEEEVRLSQAAEEESKHVRAGLTSADDVQMNNNGMLQAEL